MTGLQFNFGTKHNNSNWRIVNDGVMGGLSTSLLKTYDNSILFSGTTSLKNNGGFASMRTYFDQGALDGSKTMTIRYKSNSVKREFGISLKDSQRYYIPYYKFTFTPKTKDWEEITVALKDFKHVRLSQTIGPQMPSEFLKEAYSLVLIVGDKKAGDFDIEIDYIKFN